MSGDLKLPQDCFLCGFTCWPNTDTVEFSLDSGLAPDAPAHRLCILSRKVVDVTRAYHRWCGDMVDVPRASLGAIGRA